MGGFDEYAGDYDAALRRGPALSGEGREHFARERVRWLAAQVAELGSGLRVLDFGCGTGTASPFLARELGAREVVGVDVSQESLAVARREHADVARFIALDELDGEEPFDLAYCNGVFHHVALDERLPMLRAVHARLRPEALFSLWENNPYNPGTRLVMSRIPFDRDARLLRPVETRRLGQAAGFEVVRTDHLFIFPRFLSVLRPLERPLARYPIGGQYQVLLRRPSS